MNQSGVKSSFFRGTVVGGLAVLLVTVSVFLTGCERVEAPSSGFVAESFWEIPVDAATLTLELALGEEEMARGLMFREELQPGSGMLFLYPQPRQLSFWMRNTPLPLDIAFFDVTGTIREIHRLYPFDETPVRSASDAIVGAIEMKRGEFARLGLGVGSRIDAPVLEKAIRQSGRNPGDYVFP